MARWEDNKYKQIEKEFNPHGLKMAQNNLFCLFVCFWRFISKFFPNSGGQQKHSLET